MTETGGGEDLRGMPPTLWDAASVSDAAYPMAGHLSLASNLSKFINSYDYKIPVTVLRSVCRRLRLGDNLELQCASLTNHVRGPNRLSSRDNCQFQPSTDTNSGLK